MNWHFFVFREQAAIEKQKAYGMLCLFFSLIGCLSLSAQSHQIYGGVLLGRAVPNHPKYPEITTIASGLEVGWKKKVTGKAIWHKYFHFPEMGVQMSVWNIGNPQVLGQGYIITPTFTRQVKQSPIYYSLGSSLAFLTHTFDHRSNPTHTAAGSHLTSSTFFQLQYLQRIYAQWDVGMALRITHFSNGNTSSPNLGINIPALVVSVHQKIETPLQAEIPLQQDTLYSKKLSPFVNIGMGRMQAEVPAGPNFRLWASSIGIQRNISPIFRGRAGLAGYYSTKHAEQLRFSDEEVPGIGQKAWGFAPFLGGEWMLGHIGLVVQGGPYLIRPATMKKFSYTQYGFQFYPFDIQRRPHRQMYLRVFVHAHDFEADFAEIGLGYQW